MSQFPLEIKNCPACGRSSSETLTRLAWKELLERGKVSKTEVKLAVERAAVPMNDPQKPPVFSVDALLLSYDVCLCGTRYVTDADIVNLPIQSQPASKGPGNHFGHIGRG